MVFSASINKLCPENRIRNGIICSSTGVDVTCPTTLLQHDIWLLRVNCHGFDFPDRHGAGISAVYAINRDPLLKLHVVSFHSQNSSNVETIYLSVGIYDFMSAKEIQHQITTFTAEYGTSSRFVYNIPSLSWTTNTSSSSKTCTDIVE